MNMTINMTKSHIPDNPEKNTPVSSATTKQTLVYGVPGYRHYLLLVPSKYLHLLHCAYVEYLELFYMTFKFEEFI